MKEGGEQNPTANLEERRLLLSGAAISEAPGAEVETFLYLLRHYSSCSWKNQFCANAVPNIL